MVKCPDPLNTALHETTIIIFSNGTPGYVTPLRLRESLKQSNDLFSLICRRRVVKSMLSIKLFFLSFPLE